jgi:hypothetical protein
MTAQWIEPELCKLVTRIPAGDNWVAAAPLTIRACMRKPSNLISCADDAQRARLDGEVSGRSPPPSARSTAGRPIRAMLFPELSDGPPCGGSNEQPLGDLPRGVPTGPLSSETRRCMRRFGARRHKPQPKSGNFVKLLHNYHHHYNYYHYSPDCSAPHSNRVLTDFG